MPDKAPDVWITGIGLISSLGEGNAAHFAALSDRDGRPVLNETTYSPYPVHPLTSVDFGQQIPKKSDQRQMELWQRIGVYAAGQALEDAGIAYFFEHGESAHTLVLADGRAHALDAQDLSIEPLAHWTSPRSNGRYPQRWRLTSATMGLDVTVESLLADQELDTARSTGVTYWEGAVSVSGQVRGAPVTGRGYVEMTGYAERFTPKL